jgi:type I restriction enzyme, R subunit
MTVSPERDLVELPFVDQLVSMGWRHTTGNVHDPTATGRASFRDVLIRDDLARALERLNLRDGVPWLDRPRIDRAISALDQPAAGGLIQANQAATRLLIEGVVVDGLPDWDHGRDRTLSYVDWDHPERNTFRVVDQLRVDEPGTGGRRYIVPDLVLFVNGIPLVVVECKSPGSVEPIARAIEDLQAYANQRDWIAGDEGNEQLFHTNQIVVATCYDEARLATFTARASHFMEWKDTAPAPKAEVAKALGKGTLSSQELLVAGALRPAHLLDIVRHFTLFRVVGGRTVKDVCRYPQFRAVQRAIVPCPTVPASASPARPSSWATRSTRTRSSANSSIATGSGSPMRTARR